MRLEPLRPDPARVRNWRPCGLVVLGAGCLGACSPIWLLGPLNMGGNAQCLRIILLIDLVYTCWFAATFSNSDWSGAR